MMSWLSCLLVMIALKQKLEIYYFPAKLAAKLACRKICSTEHCCFVHNSDEGCTFDTC